MFCLNKYSFQKLNGFNAALDRIGSSFKNRFPRKYNWDIGNNKEYMVDYTQRYKYFKNTNTKLQTDFQFSLMIL